jgi:hypothetical protein
MDSLCELIHHKHNIHEIRMHDNSRQAVDVMTARMEALIESWNTDEDGDEMRLLINMSESGVPSVTYAMQKIRKWFNDYRNILGNMHIREAYLAPTSSEMVLSLAESFAKVLPIAVEVKFFPQDDHESAIEWLRETDADSSGSSPSNRSAEDTAHER